MTNKKCSMTFSPGLRGRLVEGSVGSTDGDLADPKSVVDDVAANDVVTDQRMIVIKLLFSVTDK